MIAEFRIQGIDFAIDQSSGVGSSFKVESYPRSYYVDFTVGNNPSKNLIHALMNEYDPILLMDQQIKGIYFRNNDIFKNIPTFQVNAEEKVKTIDTALEIVDFLYKNHATKASMLFVIGGGILQDLGSFSCAIYKRGIPWTYIPTTLVSQGDSCIGGKTALNYNKTKNLLALFSAPRKVIIDVSYLKSLRNLDLMSGIGEIFRLCITGGFVSLDFFSNRLQAFLDNVHEATNQLISIALLVKRAVVEYDEFELDVRRSMNYGHSFGHALEALTSYRIPHGVGVTIGILVENEISFQRGILDQKGRDYILRLGKQLVPERCKKILISLSLNGIIDLLRHDKKAEADLLKIATLKQIGEMTFIDFPLNEKGEQELENAVLSIINEF